MQVFLIGMMMIGIWIIISLFLRVLHLKFIFKSMNLLKRQINNSLYISNIRLTLLKPQLNKTKTY